MGAAEVAAGADGDIDLDSFMAGFDAAHGYTTRELLKENPWERTELVEDAKGTLYARKYLKIDPANGRPHPYERAAGISCPYLPRVVSTLREGDVLVVICEWVQGEDLQRCYEKYGRPTDAERAQVFDDVCEAVAALHDAPGGPIVHRDVNPSNIVFDGRHAHLIDLGIARAWHEGASADTHLWGTAGYAAPEQYGFGQSDERADVYALGKLLRFLFTGRHPNEGLDAPLPANVAQVVERACHIDPDERYQSVGELRHAADRCLRAPAGPIAWRAHQHPVLWYLWCIVAWAFFGFMVFGSVGSVVTGLSPASYILAYLFLDGFGVLVPVVLLTGSFGVTERIAWFQGQRRARIAAVSLASLVIGFFGCGVFAGWF